MTARNRLRVTAARAYNASRVHIHAGHILPACAPTIVVGITLGLTETVLLESTLSFLGGGCNALSSLGSIVGFGSDYLMTPWWIALAPGFVVADSDRSHDNQRVPTPDGTSPSFFHIHLRRRHVVSGRRTLNN